MLHVVSVALKKLICSTSKMREMITFFFLQQGFVFVHMA